MLHFRLVTTHQQQQIYYSLSYLYLRFKSADSFFHRDFILTRLGFYNLIFMIATFRCPVLTGHRQFLILPGLSPGFPPVNFFQPHHQGKGSPALSLALSFHREPRKATEKTRIPLAKGRKRLISKTIPPRRGPAIRPRLMYDSAIPIAWP